ncbi:histidine phosphatase family protein [Serinibacter arcticus]|uniref:Putative phosphoglycerate mutase family protein n=1 Tax=Serinibacter arcticus TaxID=1655435 RepID=A0A4Z1E3F3_9MICO|nr:histidine phosphatase family protein [Serinibacter arcticus]TGO04191.1 putative phosphoglycerate mutase family protein [Serinibacter arcticus]
MSHDARSGSTAPGELVLVRHGETAWSSAGRHTGRSDVPLTADGEAQARATGAALHGREFALVLTSPLGRARRTAELAGYGGSEIDPDLAEWDYGPVEGLTRTQVSDALGRRWAALTDGVRVPLTVSGLDDLPAEQRNPDPGDGELVEEVAARAARVIARAEPVLRDGHDVLFVAHGHLLRILTAAWLELHPEVAERLVLGTAARCVLGYDRGARSLVHWNVLP